MKAVLALTNGARALVLVAFFVLTFAALPALPQSLDQIHVAPADRSPARADQLPARSRPLRVDVDLVLVPTTVTDSFNRPVTSLQQRDFALFEGNEPQDIKFFNEEDAPISIGILLDTSGSMKSKYDLARQAVSEFFRNANSNDDYFVITYSNVPVVLADTTQSVDSIEARLESVIPNGSTPLLDAIYLGLTKLKKSRYQRRALLIISDGGDNTSRYNTREIRDLVQESDVQVYALGMFGPVTIAIEDWAGKKLLNTITEATGGRAVFFSSASKLPEVAASFSRELRNQYVLGYRPSNPQKDGKLHKIRVKVTTPIADPVQVHYKREYLAARY